MQEINKLELLMQFVQQDDRYRKHLCKPIRRDGYLYATNGWIAIRIPDDLSIEASSSQESPNLADIFERGDVEFHPLPALPEAAKCRSCNWSGKEYLEDCEECDGDGEFIHGSHTYSCKECDGEGQVNAFNEKKYQTKCRQCAGIGDARPDDTKANLIQIGELHFQIFLLRMVEKLPNARIEHSTNAKQIHAYFIFDGGEGVIMPVRV